MSRVQARNNFSLDDLYTFIKAVEIGSFTNTAKYFSVNNTTISRKIANLEDMLGVKLVEKTNNSFHPTIVGKRLFDQIYDSSFNFGELQLLVRNIIDDDLVPGALTIVVPLGVGLYRISPHLHGFMLTNPRIRLNLCYQNSEPELVKSNVDLAIISCLTGRHVNQKFKKIASFPVKLVCTRKYKEKYGIPQTPQDIIRHQCVGLLDDNFSVHHRMNFIHRKTGSRIEIEMPNNITTNSIINNIELVNTNEMIAGIADYGDFFAANDQYIQVLPDYELDPYILYLLKHPYRQDKAIDLFATFLEALFRG